MPTAYNTYIIQLGIPTVVTSSLTILSIGQDGTQAATRGLVHPDSSNFAPITYQRNPDFTSNLDNQVLTSPMTKLVKTATSSLLIRNEGLLIDVICEETWGAQAGRVASMPTYFFRELYQYLINPPAFNPAAQTYIEWSPRDRSGITYNIEFHKMTVGSGAGAKVFTVPDRRGPSGNPIMSPFESFDVSPTGLVDQPVTNHYHIINAVAS